MDEGQKLNVLIDIEKAFDIIQHPFMIKIFDMLSVE
jgi:hypothetical protein